MTYYAVSPGNAVKLIPKNASSSMAEALAKIDAPVISEDEAKQFDNVVAWVRDYNDRLRSVFQQVYDNSYGNSIFDGVPKGIVKAWGLKYKHKLEEEDINKRKGWNFHRWTPADEEALMARVNQIKRANQGVTETQVTEQLDNDDYRSFVDFTMSSDDPHWNPQSDLIKGRDGSTIVTTTIDYEDLGDTWSDYVPVGLPETNVSTNRPIDDTYKSTELDTKYSGDTAIRERK